MRILFKFKEYLHYRKDSLRLPMSDFRIGETLDNNSLRKALKSSRGLPFLPFPNNPRFSPFLTNSYGGRRHYSNSSSPTDISSRQLDMLVKEGFTSSQGEAIVGLLTEAIEERYSHQIPKFKFHNHDSFHSNSCKIWGNLI